MSVRSELLLDEDLAHRLPLPLAQLYRRAHNAKTALERHLTAYYLWEAALKLLASGAVVAYAGRTDHDPELAERLAALARPALGHWWEFVRRLLPVLADGGDPGFQGARDVLLGRTRDDLPRAAGLDAALREVLEGKGGARVHVRLTELFDRLVQYRNRELGHGAAGRRSEEYYERMGRAILAGVAEVLGRLDVLAGRQLLYVAEVRRQAAGDWLVERYELVGEIGRRLESATVPAALAVELPRPEQVYLAPSREAEALTPLHPLIIYEAEASEVLFLNARRGARRTEYLSYTTGRTADRSDLGGEQRALLARVLGMSVDGAQVEQWAARSQAEDPAAGGEPGDAPRRRLGEFELHSELGRGGMGRVYRAWQPSLGRQVALKELLRTGDARSESRFAREIRALGRVEHPNLVKIFTSGSEGDQWFYAMELIEGASLGAVCGKLQTDTASVTQVDLKTWQETVGEVCAEAHRAEKPLSTSKTDDPAPSVPPAPPASFPPVTGRGYVEHVVELVRQVAEAGHALNEAGVVHRDIKPDNIMVTAGGSQAVLMDLGLAQLADETEGRLTRTRQFVGTLRYASPEQVLNVARLDRRSDVYSLGATLWELLTLRPLFGATEQTPTPELMQRIQYGEPEPPHRYHPGLARDLESVVLKCLEKDPARRYATAGELADDLRRWLTGEPVRAQPPTLRYVLAKLLRRQRKRLAVVTTVAFTYVALAFGLYHLFHSTGDSPTGPGAGGQVAAPEAPPGKRRALLVGCSRYANLKESWRLRGPENDVELMRQLLLRFNFDADNIVRLTDDAADPERTPTRARIEREMLRLSDLAEPGDQIIVYLSGHGTAQPAPELADSPGGTGALENVFLPTDVGRWDDPKAVIPNGIPGRQLARWVKTMLDRQASVWIIFDACGKPVGASDNPYASLGPAPGLARGLEWYRSPLDLPTEAPGLVALYAGQPGETVSEIQPSPGSSGMTYGMFTYTMNQVLTQAAAPLTYAQLAQRVRARYAAQGRARVTPMVEGGDRSRLVLDGKPWPGQSGLTVARNEAGDLLVNGGTLRGLTLGSILAVWPPDSQGEAPLGHVRIQRTWAYDSEVVPCAYAGKPVPADLPTGGRCRLALFDFGRPHASVAVSDWAYSGQLLGSREPARQRLAQLGQDLRTLAARSGPFVELAAEDGRADFLLLLASPESKQAYLVWNDWNDTAAGPESVTRGLARDWSPVVVLGPTPCDQILTDWKDAFVHIGRMQRLLALARSPEEEQVLGRQGVDLGLELLKLRTWNDPEGEVISRQGGPVSLSDGDWIGFRVTNQSAVEVDVTVLFLDVTGFQVVYPRSGTRNRLRPGAGVQCDPARIRTAVRGRQYVVALAARAEGPLVDFNFLAEPDFDKAEALAAAQGTAERTLLSPLGRLLQTALYSRGNVHALDSDTLGRFALRKLSWPVVPRTTPNAVGD